MVLLVLACQSASVDTGTGACAPDEAEQTAALHQTIREMESEWSGCVVDTDCTLADHPDPRFATPLSINAAYAEAWESEGEALYAAYWADINGDACGPWGAEPGLAGVALAVCRQCQCVITYDANEAGPDGEECPSQK